MPSPRRLTTLAVSLALAASVLSAPVAGAQSLGQARAERAALQERLDAAAVQLNDLEVRQAELEGDQQLLEAQLAQYSYEARAAETRINSRIREVFKHGAQDPVLQLLTGTDPQDAIAKATTIEQLIGLDRAAAEVAVGARARADNTATLLAQSEAELAATVATQRDALAALQTDLEAARKLEARLVEDERRRQEEARRRAEAERRAAEAASRASRSSLPAPAPPATGGGGSACPIGQPRSFTDTWGAARSGGRGHKGVDMLAPYGTPIYAVTSGIWDVRSYGSSAGNWAMLRGDNGHVYYYMHLQSHQVGDGARVSAGQLTGTNGDTGNARGTPHLHFEYHPGGGGAVNPYPLVKGLCG
jgi:murein DD-endopeptidase MepM/ murein hydrolase activator NlpD